MKPMQVYETHKAATGEAGEKIYRIYLDSSAASGDRFYCRMGRFFADRQISRELEEPMFDGPDCHWLIAFDDDRVAAFGCLDASRLARHGEALLTYGYVLPEHRGRRLHTALFAARLRLAGELGATVVRGVANDSSRRTFAGNGFDVVRQAGRFTHFRKRLDRQELGQEPRHAGA
jgi:GNAT superfamily N-acetyltransferase